MMINGTNGADSTNSRLKIAFGPNGSLIAGDNFEIKDLDIFGFLKNLKESLENNNTTGIKSAIQDMDLSLDVLNKDITKVGMFNSKVRYFDAAEHEQRLSVHDDDVTNDGRRYYAAYDRPHFNDEQLPGFALLDVENAEPFHNGLSEIRMARRPD